MPRPKLEPTQDDIRRERRTASLQVRIKPSTMITLKHACNIEGVSVSEAVEHGIRRFIETSRIRHPKQFPSNLPTVP